MADRSRSRSPSQQSRSQSPRSTAHRASSDSKLCSARGEAACLEYKRRHSTKSPPAHLLKQFKYSIDFGQEEITHILKNGDRISKKLDKDTKDTLERICSSDPKINQFCGGPYLVESDYEDMEKIDKIFKKLPLKDRPKGGSRRRPSRKSKRVLRRKSRSTRRR